jgi:fibronectin-binding autotransporter adhesin
MLPTRTRISFLALLALSGLAVLASRAVAQPTYTWKGANTGGTWRTASNWTPPPSLTFPGVDGNNTGGTTGDLASFSFTTAATRSVGLDFSTTAGTGLNGTLSLGALNYKLTSGSNTFTLGNQSSSNGVLTLNGATVAGFDNVIIANTSTTGATLAISQNVGSGTGSMPLALTNAGGVVLAQGSSTVTLGTNLNQASSYTAGLVAEGAGTINLNAIANLGGGLISNVANFKINSTGQWTGSDVTVTSGILTLASVTGIADASAVTVDAGGTFVMTSLVSKTFAGLTLNGSGQKNQGVLYSSAGDLSLTAPNGVTLSGGSLLRATTSTDLTFQNDISGPGAITKVGTGALTLNGTSTYTGGTAVFEGRVNFNTPDSVPGSGQKVFVLPGASVFAGFAVDQAFVARLGDTRGRVILGADSSESLDLSAVGPVSLAGTGITYSGSLTPYNSTFQFTGASDSITVSSPLGGANSLIIGGGGTESSSVSLTEANTYTGSTHVGVGEHLYISSIDNGGQASNIGASSADPSNLVINNGALHYTGATKTIDRGFTIMGNTNMLMSAKVTFTGDLVRVPGSILGVNISNTLGLTTIDGVPVANTLINGILPFGYTAGGNLLTVSGGFVTTASTNYSGALSAAATTSYASVTNSASVANRTITSNLEITAMRVSSTEVMIDGPDTTLKLDAGQIMLVTSTLRSSNADKITNVGKVTTGAPSGELFIYAQGSSDAVYASIVDNGSTPTRLIVHATNPTLTLAGTSTHTGGTVVAGGHVKVSNAAAFGTGTVEIRAGYVYIDPGLVMPNNFYINNPDGGAPTLGVNTTSASNVRFNGSLTLTGVGFIQSSNAGGLTFAGPIQGNGDLIFVTPSDFRTIVLDRPSGAASDLTGNIFLNPGIILQAGANNELGDRTLSDNALLRFGENSTLRFSPSGADVETVNALSSLTTGAGIVETITGAGNVFKLRVGGANGSGTFSGIIRESSGATLQLEKVGTGTQVLAGANSYTGGTTVANGILRLGANNTIPNVGTLLLSGGTLSTGATTGYSVSVGPLEVTANSTIALGTGSHTVTFDGIVAAPTGVLLIEGWVGGPFLEPGTEGRLLFHLPSSSADQANLDFAAFRADVQFSGFPQGYNSFIATAQPNVYELVAAPEPTTILGLASAGLLALRRLRRRRQPTPP